MRHAEREQQQHSEENIVFVFDARGNGGGITAPTITGNHQDRITDYTAIVVERHGIYREPLRRLSGD